MRRSNWYFGLMLLGFLGLSLTLAACDEGGRRFVEDDDTGYAPARTWRDSRTFSRHTNGSTGSTKLNDTPVAADDILSGGL